MVDADSGGEQRFGGALEEPLSGKSGLGFPRFLRRVVNLVLFPFLFIPFVKLESRNTCRRTLKLFAKK